MPIEAHDLVLPYIRQLSRHVDTLLAKRFEGATDLWRLQLQLLDLQRELQDRIREFKQLPRSEPDRLANVHAFRELLRDSRRLGDSFAWLALGLNRKLIYPLAENQRNSVPTRSPGNNALVLAAEYLSSRGYGFPLLHDITDVLRIGDITFIRPNSSPLTIEVKSKVVTDQAGDDGKRFVEYSIEAHYLDDDGLASALAEQGWTETIADIAPHDRLGRQLIRMTRAQARRTLADNVPIDLGGRKMIALTVQTDDLNYASSVNKAVWEARRCSVGTATADETFVFLALYDSKELTPEALQLALGQLDAAETLRSVLAGDDLRNSIVINQIPRDDLKATELHMPYFLLPLPRRAIQDILHGRLALIVLWNPARVAQTLERSGFVVNFSERGGGHPPAMIVSWDYQGVDGSCMRAEIHRLDTQLTEMVMELRPASYIVRMVEAMRDASQQHARGPTAA